MNLHDINWIANGELFAIMIVNQLTPPGKFQLNPNLSREPDYVTCPGSPSIIPLRYAYDRSISSLFFSGFSSCIVLSFSVAGGGQETKCKSTWKNGKIRRISQRLDAHVEKVNPGVECLIILVIVISQHR